MNTIKIKTSEIDNYFSGLAAMQAKATMSIKDHYIVTVGLITFQISN